MPHKLPAIVTPEDLTGKKWRTSVGRNSASKMGNARVFFDNFWFMSQREADRWQELKLLQTAGHIKELRRQVPYKLTSHDQFICRYVADYEYVEDGKLVVEDSKGFQTAVFKIKWKMLQAQYPGLVCKIT